MAWSPERRWALLRLLLGFAQLFGTSLSLVLLFLTGVTTVALTALVLTGLCTAVSVLLFGAKAPRRGHARQP